MALKSNDLLGMMASITQAFILMLQMLGISYMLYALGRRLLGAILKRGALRHGDV